MSIPAQKWAMEQKIGSASAKFVLVVLSTYCDFNGSCWPSQERLGHDTDQSVDTVQRCLYKLQAMGLVYLGPRRVKKNGHAGVRQMVVLYDTICVDFALSLGYDPAEIARKAELARGKGGAEENQAIGAEQMPQIAASGENADEADQIDSGNGDENRDRNLRHQDSDVQKPQIAVSADTALLRCPEQPDSELLPPKVPLISEAAALEDGSWLSSWTKLLDAWPWKPDELPEPVKRKFRDLDPDDRSAAVEWIPAYLDEVRRRQGKPMSARRWICKRGWEPFALKAKKNPTLTPGRDVFVFKGSAPWSAWAQATGKPADRMFAFQSSENGGKWGKYFPTLWPPGAARGDASQDAPSSEIVQNQGVAR